MESEILEDNKIFESEQYVFKIEKIGDSYRCIIFKKTKNGLMFFNYIIDHKLIEPVIEKFKAKSVDKILYLKEGN